MYGEVAIAVNSAFNYVLLSFAGKVSRRPCRRPRIMLASLAGAVPVVLFGGQPVITAAAFAVMAVSAFGANRNTLWKGAAATIVAALFAGGLLTVFSPSAFGMRGGAAVMLSCAAAVAGLGMLERRWRGAEADSASASFKAETVLQLFDARIRLAAFADTGNGCTEPLSGKPVHFISYRAVKDHLPAEIRLVLERLQGGSVPDIGLFPEDVRHRLRLIRITTIGGSEWAVGFKVEKWIYADDGKEIGGYFVLTAGNAEYPLGADAILHRTSVNRQNERG
ncbi:sigma-E processing peptidase SpoIIGA [Edaphobacillus lindanitolerans]|uniref:Stage II sporulation protein GA (Sporulation sigma-E factor processing peptidase) n=1 Tax=Edaphobacillus lindanitolerans TaxID=550447 RepID=A0A1U7PIP2_9BACI|nr:sigma-E processing peptidase SpoIIGA [Edaphobacillus lindanitolerans]SIT67803.1 stage II sporulation protein GA (sporulation sigma-E factor processing peptidase) [Edaphobacillus lindanitolerans]